MPSCGCLWPGRLLLPTGLGVRPRAAPSSTLASCPGATTDRNSLGLLDVLEIVPVPAVRTGSRWRSPSRSPRTIVSNTRNM
ncbi:hypothetical protein GGR56DRAFT_661385 [Xylariaceae sp. FL0804]|nr:hypothetical protein GGR56DRAFT_661385 [Xylariaceae sp. FL0804]